MEYSNNAPALIEDEVRVSVIIVNWNTLDLLRDCIRSVMAETKSPYEIIVVDNASSDDSAAMVQSEFPDAILIANQKNMGFAGANNQGLGIASGQSVLLLNPDTIVLDRAIDKMLDWLNAHNDVGCVGCQVLEGPGIIQRTCFADPGPANLVIVELGLMRLAKYIRFFGRPWYTWWDRCSSRDVDVVSGMFMLVPRNVLEQVGPLDDAFFIYAEEADWCRRIRSAGWRCVFTPEAQIIHLDGGSKSTSQIGSKMYVQMQKSHLIYVRKHYGWPGFLAVKALFVFSAIGRFCLFGVLQMLRPNQNTRARVRLSLATLRYHIIGQEPG